MSASPPPQCPQSQDARRAAPTSFLRTNSRKTVASGTPVSAASVWGTAHMPFLSKGAESLSCHVSAVRMRCVNQGESPSFWQPAWGKCEIVACGGTLCACKRWRSLIVAFLYPCAAHRDSIAPFFFLFPWGGMRVGGNVMCVMGGEGCVLSPGG